MTAEHWDSNKIKCDDDVIFLGVRKCGKTGKSVQESRRAVQAVDDVMSGHCHSSAVLR